MIEIRLPKPGPEIEEATITTWECAEGDKILIGDILAIIKTPIGSFKVAAEEQGILESILQAKGDTINFEEPIALLKPELTISDFKETTEEDSILPFPDESGDEADTETSPEEEKIIEFVNNSESTDDESVQEEPETEAVDESADFSQSDEPETDLDLSETDEDTPPAPLEEAVPFDQQEEEINDAPDSDSDVTEVAEAEETEVPVSDSEDATVPDNLEFEISPAAMKLADQTGIDIESVKGTGDDGKIHFIDVENAIWERAKTNQMKENAPSAETEPESELNTEDESSIDEPGEDLDSDQGEADSTETEPELDPEIPSIADELGDEDSFDSEEPEATEEVIDSEFHEKEEDLPTEASDIKDEEIPDSEETEEPEKVVDTPAAEFLLSKPKPSPDFDEISIQYNMERKDDLIIPFNTVKKSYAELQAESNSSVPHLNLFAEVDFTDACKWRETYNKENDSDITVTDLIVKVCGHALALMPEINAYVRPDRIILKRSINIGVTTSIDEGVVTPVVPDVYHKSLEKVSDVIKKNTSLATKSKVVLDYDTAFTISNLGMYGVKRFIPLVAAPQSACLAVGEISKKVVPVNDFVGIRSIVELTLACDHRAIDGTMAARFLQIIREDLESMVPGEDPDWIKGNEQLRLI